MKKGLSYIAVAAVALSAVSVAPITSEAASPTGVYDTTANKYYSTAQFQKLTNAEKGTLLTKAGVYFVVGTKVVPASAVAGTNAEIKAAAIDKDKFTAANLDAIHAGTTTPVTGELKVESVSAINKTTLTVTLGTAVDSVTASNFTIAGANVTAATLAADKKTVTLTVSGLAYNTDYTLEAKNIQVAGSAKDFTSKAFKTVGVNDLWELKITAKNASLIADGADNTEVTFQLINKVTGAVDTNADNVVLDLNTTFGTLAQKRVTIQNGTATLLLTSEFQNAAVTAKIDAQIIEASGDYKDLIGQVFGTLNVPFNPTNVDNVQSITAVSAEANQADRFTVFFDKDVALTQFVKHTNGVLAYNYFNTTTNLTSEVLATNLTEAQKADQINLTHVLANALEIKQGTKTTFKVKGFKTVANNPKAIEVILDKSTPLTDNEQVNVGLNTTNSLGKVTKSEVSFKVTDARVPSATSVAVEGLNTLKVKFSEAIKETTLGINGQFKGEAADTESAAKTRVTAINTAAATGNKTGAFVYYFGDFNPFTQVDNRDLATVLLTKNYIEDGTGKVAGFFSATSHSVQVASSKDFAALSDTNNVGTTQNLTFAVAADTGIPTASVVVESPEQFRLKFDKTVSMSEAAVQNLISNGKIKLQVKNTAGTFVDATTLLAAQGQVTLADLLITYVENNEYVIELLRDWTLIHDTAATNKNYYNYEYQLVVAKDSFTNNGNGKKNEEQKLSLNYTGSPLNTPDTLSPVISNVVRQGATNTLHVTMSEPVKLKSGNTIRDNAGETKAQTQTVLENTTVQFMGKDKDGKIVTIDGVVGDYLTTIRGADNQFAISWAAGAVTPQSVTDAGGSTEWEVVVRVITDDVGNAAASVKYPVTIAKTTGTSAFFIDKYAAGGTNAGKYRVEGYSTADTAGTDLRDKVEIIFSEGVQWTDIHDATNPAQYTLNGKTLPVGTVIEVFDVGGTTGYAASAHATATGIEGVRITLPDGTLNIGAGYSNVITVNKNLTSYDGTVITGETEIVVNVAENIALTNLNNTIIAADAAQKAAATSVAAVIPATQTALAPAYGTYAAAVTAYATAVTTAKTDLATATPATADGFKATLDTATTTFNAAKTAYETAVTALATARTSLTTAKTTADTTQKAAAAVVAAASASDRTALAPVYGNYATAVTDYAAAVTAANAVLTNPASTTAQLDGAVTALATATAAFDSAKIAYDTAVTALATARTNLTNAIAAANTNLATGTVTAAGSGAGNVTQGQKDAYQLAITTATTANSATATVTDLTSAVGTLATATAAFDAAKAL